MLAMMWYFCRKRCMHRGGTQKWNSTRWNVGWYTLLLPCCHGCYALRKGGSCLCTSGRPLWPCMSAPPPPHHHHLLSDLPPVVCACQGFLQCNMGGVSDRHRDFLPIPINLHQAHAVTHGTWCYRLLHAGKPQAGLWVLTEGCQWIAFSTLVPYEKLQRMRVGRIL